MLVYSPVHPWQNLDAVMQQLVFPSQEAADSFKVTMAERMKNKKPGDSIEDVSDNNAGAFVKLRAVLQSNGKYSPVIRCGVTGVLIWDNITVQYESYHAALSDAKLTLKQLIITG